MNIHNNLSFRQNVHIDIPHLALENDEDQRLNQLDDEFKKEDDSYVASFTIDEGVNIVERLFLEVFLLEEAFELELELELE